MRRRFLLDILVLGLVSPSPAAIASTTLTDPRLIGTWRSDRELTMRYYCLPPNVSERTKHQLAEMFGKVVWRFTQRQFSFQLDQSRFTKLYRVIAKDATSVVIRVGDAGDAAYLQHIWFEDDHMYTLGSKYNIEFFKRIQA
jgi:hypothetical protein